MILSVGVTAFTMNEVSPTLYRQNPDRDDILQQGAKAP